MSGIRVKQHNYSFLEAVIAHSTSPSPPTNCATANYTNGCCVGDCSVILTGGEICYCAQSCYDSDECCDDIEQIGCPGKF